MKRATAFLTFAALVYGACTLGARFLKMNELMQFIILLVVGTMVGAVLIKVYLPQCADWVVRFLFSWNDPPSDSDDSPSSPVTAMLAQGNYQAAIAEYQKMLKAQPLDAYACAEIGRIYAERMNEPLQAAEWLRDQLAAQPWSVNDSAYLRFRLVDVLLLAEDQEGAERLLEYIIAHYPSTQHCGSAMHKLHSLRPRQVPHHPNAWSA